MQDIIKHNQHTDGFCRVCRHQSAEQKLLQSHRRVGEIIRDIWTGLEQCSHPHTRTVIEPDFVEGDDNLVLEAGEKYIVCRDCLNVRAL